MKIVDFEAHYYPPALMELFSTRQACPRYVPEDYFMQFREGYFIRNKEILTRVTEPLEARIAFMDAFGIQTQVLSISPGVELLEREDASAMARAANEYVYAAMERYPGRFLGFASLPVHDADTAVRELERCIKQLGFIGWNTFSNFGPTAPDEAQFYPIWEAAAALHAPVYLHPTDPYYGRFGGLGPQLSSAALGFGVDTSITLMRLIFSGVLDKNPGLRILLGHLGEALPFTLERMDNRCRLDKGPPAKNRQLPSYYFKKNIYVTTSGQNSHAAFRCTKSILGMDHILFGSDYPYEKPEEVRDFLRELEISQTEREQLFYKNAEEVFGRQF